MPDTRRRLLFLCQNLPFPPDGGALIRSYHTMRLLARDFDVTALCFHRAATRRTPDAVRRGIAGLSELAEARAFPIPQERSRTRLVLDHVRSVLTGRAYTRWTYDSAAFRRALDEALRGDPFDVVHVDSLDLVAYLPRLGGLPLALAHHNIESRLLARRAESESGLRRWYLGMQSSFTEREERRWCPEVALNVVVSEDDGSALARIAPEAPRIVVPNGVDTGFFRPGGPPDHRRLVFVGGHTWFPNRDGMDYFVREILPLIRERMEGVEVTWVGRAPEEVRRRFRSWGVRMTGYVDDIRPWVREASCYVVPLRVGGGTRLKILDAWSMGKAVVSTSRGCEGLEAEHGDNILVADDPPTFAEAVVRVLDDDALRGRLEEAARSTAVRRYDWEVIGEPMRAAYRGLSERAEVG